VVAASSRPGDLGCLDGRKALVRGKPRVAVSIVERRRTSQPNGMTHNGWPYRKRNGVGVAAASSGAGDLGCLVGVGIGVAVASSGAGDLGCLVGIGVGVAAASSGAGDLGCLVGVLAFRMALWSES